MNPNLGADDRLWVMVNVFGPLVVIALSCLGMRARYFSWRVTLLRCIVIGVCLIFAGGNAYRLLADTPDGHALRPYGALIWLAFAASPILSTLEGRQQRRSIEGTGDEP